MTSKVAMQELAGRHGFALVGATGIDLASAEPGLRQWLEAGFHGSMEFMRRHGMRRARPDDLVPGTVSVWMVALDYRPVAEDWRDEAWRTIGTPGRAYVSRYALGRDYHKVVRQRLNAMLADMRRLWGDVGGRVFCDSAPVLEVELARRAGLGWRGKHTLLLSRERGSMFFLGTLYLDRDVGDAPPAVPRDDGVHCGSCTRCIEVCPTRAIVAPYRVDARRCISYLTIETDDPVPEPLRRAMGNRIYGCDDCQLVCPWNRYAQPTQEPDFAPRHALDQAMLLDLFAWDEPTFMRRLEGSAIRRIGHRRWQRNLAVALGNALRDSARTAGVVEIGEASEAAAIVTALRRWLDRPATQRDPMVEEHVRWALEVEPARQPPADDAAALRYAGLPPRARTES